ncbi:MAG: trypsin-like peptidase domain-containing protein [candidate division KSB1 bacterium]|nr:trypsin-like peptidase domain-containing protein [candidate division KSB1 bacterium]MDZ7365056.1 trypsin-like peptidase domain-containing protein [candidate division KSB1 bacterium]MDZ7403450.1 trypsin-like peptidase domain-containing protein [candidate division KSB1 bacterium]
MAGLLLAAYLKFPPAISASSLLPFKAAATATLAPDFELPPPPSSQSQDSELIFPDLKRAGIAFSQVAGKVVPVVVSIATHKIIPATESERAAESIGRENFFDGRSLRFYPPRTLRQHGTGSGIIISPDGYILTNLHVIQHAVKITVTLHDNRAFSGKIAGVDPLTEVAVIKINARGLPTAVLGNSDGVFVGQWVLAVGNPLNLRSTVTAGIISAAGRDIDIIRGNYGVENFIQTDAAINPGNSGGALVNLDGQVIGVNTAIATETGYAMGLGFAIPINLARKIAVDLIRHGKVARGYLGVALQEITELQARALKLGTPAGVLVDDVYPGSPAEKSGLLPLDVILSIDGIAVQRLNQLQALIAAKSPDAAVTLRLLRSGKEMAKTIVLGELPAAQMKPRAGANQLDRSRFKNLGIEVETITVADAAALDYKGEGGIFVTRVEKFSPAEESGLRADDIISAIDRKTVRTKNDFYLSLQKLKTGDVAIFAVIRRGGQYHLFIEVP